MANKPSRKKRKLARERIERAKQHDLPSVLLAATPVRAQATASAPGGSGRNQRDRGPDEDQPTSLPRFLREEDIEQFFAGIKSKRDWAMFKLMLRCGLRVEEVAKLTLGAVDLKRRRIMVLNGKGGKDRVVYISDDAHDALAAYLKARSHCRAKKVFLVEKGDFKGQPISVRGIQKRMEYYAKKTGVAACCHRLRHTMATQLLNAEAEIETIQDLLGHNWITTTQRYCQVSNLKVQRDYHKAMRIVLKKTYAQPADGL